MKQKIIKFVLLSPSSLSAFITSIVCSVLFVVCATYFTGCDIGNSSRSDSSSSISTITTNTNIEEGEDGIDGGGDDEDGANPDCSDGVNGVDGPGNFLWKSESETDGNLVILFPSEFDVVFLGVEVIDVDGNIEDGVFTGFSNGGRPTWRFNMSGDSYTGRITVDDVGQECEWFVEEPGERQD